MGEWTFEKRFYQHFLCDKTAGRCGSSERAPLLAPHFVSEMRADKHRGGSHQQPTTGQPSGGACKVDHRASCPYSHHAHTHTGRCAGGGQTRDGRAGVGGVVDHRHAPVPPPSLCLCLCLGLSLTHTHTLSHTHAQVPTPSTQPSPTPQTPPQTTPNPTPHPQTKQNTKPPTHPPPPPPHPPPHPGGGGGGGGGGGVGG